MSACKVYDALLPCVWCYSTWGEHGTAALCLVLIYMGRASYCCLVFGVDPQGDYHTAALCLVIHMGRAQYCCLVFGVEQHRASIILLPCVWC